MGLPQRRRRRLLPLRALPRGLGHLQAKGFASLSGRERVALGNSLRAAFNRGTLAMKDPATREATWRWIEDNFARILAIVPKHHGQTQLISMGSVFCDEAHARKLEAFFDAARLAQIDGGPRVLAGTLEDIRLCAVKRARQEPSARALFGKRR